jgi:uncharacterized protein YdbL (DUF1318 family)
MRLLMKLCEAPSAMKKGDKIQPDQMVEGDLVELNGKTLVVVAKKMGRKFYEISLSEPSTGKTFTWKPFIGKDTQQKLIFLGKAADGDMQAGVQKRNDRADAKYDQLRQNQDALDKMDLKPGMEVLIKFRQGNYWKTVDGVDYKSGQVSVVDDHTLNANPDLYRNPHRQKRKLIPANFILDKREGSEHTSQRAADYADKLDQNRDQAAMKRELRKRMW